MLYHVKTTLTFWGSTFYTNETYHIPPQNTVVVFFGMAKPSLAYRHNILRTFK